MADIALVACRPEHFDRMVFIASTQRDRERLQKANIGEGEILEMKLRLIRNGKHHRLVFAMLRFVFDNQDRYVNEESLRRALTLETSFVREYEALDGTVIREPRSWSYDELEEDEFSQLHSELVDVVLGKIFAMDLTTEASAGAAKAWLKQGIDHQAAAEHLLSYT